MFQIIQKGSKGSQVMSWQNMLVSYGYNIKADGDFGVGTESATKDFQQKHGLSVDGKVGPATLAAIAPAITQKPVQLPSEQHRAVFDGSHIDQINSAALARVAPALQAKAKAFIAAAAADGVTLQVVQGLRTFAEQAGIYAQGRTKPGQIVTHATAGQSNHNYGVAIDCAPVVNGSVSWNDRLFVNYGKWADIAGLSWGGRWKHKDMPHVELISLPKWQTLMGWYKDGGLAAVWSKVS